MGGCSDTSNSATVSIQSAPTVTISSSGPSSFCQFDTLTSNSMPTNSSYQWKLNGSPIFGATNSTYMANSSGNYTLSVINNSCSGTSNTLSLTANPSPFVSIATSTGNTIFCQGDTIHLIATASVGATLQWTNSGFPIAGATDTAYNTMNPGYYNIIATFNNSNCSSTTSTLNIAVYPLPTPIIYSNPNVICQGSTAILMSNNFSGFTYQWKLNNTIIPGATNYIYTASTAGDYQLVETYMSNCTDSSNILTLNVASLPVPVVNYIGNMVLTTGSYYIYQWYLNGNPITGATLQQYNAPYGGNYSVQVTDTNGCADSSIVYVLLGIDDINNNQLLSISPNPFNESFTVSCPSAKGSITISDAIGKEVVRSNLSKPQQTIDMKGYSAGIYFVKYQNGNETSTQKIIKSQ